MNKIIYLSTTITMTALLLNGCASTPIEKYNPNDFVNPNRIVIKNVKTKALPTKVQATYGIGNDPAIVKAYETYTKTGVMHTVKSKGWLTYPYTADSKPIVSCQPLRLCVIQLEAGEKLNSVNLGDSVNWKVGEFLTGRGNDATISITLKPVYYDIATDLVISTDKRTYNIGLLSTKGETTQVLRFYYPEETLTNTIKLAQSQQTTNDNAIISEAQGTAIDVNHINFNYKVSGDNPPWKPSRVFDDTNKTFIQLPTISSRFELPVLYLNRHGQMQMVNYRYRAPYFIIDGLFKKAWLISGKGSSQIKVKIDNEQLAG